MGIQGLEVPKNLKGESVFKLSQKDIDLHSSLISTATCYNPHHVCSLIILFMIELFNLFLPRKHFQENSAPHSSDDCQVQTPLLYIQYRVSQQTTLAIYIYVCIMPVCKKRCVSQVELREGVESFSQR